MNKIKQFAIFLAVSFLIAIVLILITAVIFTYTNINDRYLGMFVFGIDAISSFIGALMLLRKIKEKGILYGALFGIIYFLIIYIFAAIFIRGMFFTNSTLIYMAICSLSGLVGGILGVNI